MGGGEIVKPKRRTKRTARDFTIVRAKAPRKANGAGPKHRGTLGHKFPKVPCTKCGQLIGKNQLSRHEEKCDAISLGQNRAAAAASASTQ